MTLLPFAHPEDIANWSDAAVRKLVLRMLMISQGRIKGEYVQDYDLHDCRQTFMFTRPVSHSIIFRFLHDGIELVAAGPSRGTALFKLAETRLDRA